MFKNYFKIAFRNLLRYKVYSFINILGLAISMMCCILILLWIQDELSYDRYHKNANQIYRFVEEKHYADKTLNLTHISACMAPALLNDFSEVINTVRFQSVSNIVNDVLISRGDKRFYEKKFFFADESVFDIFTFPLIKGNPKIALKEPYSVVITEEMTKKYFGNEDPLGRILRFNNAHDFKVTGVLKDIPDNSHFRFDFLGSFATLKNHNLIPGIGKDYLIWGNSGYHTYLLLPKDYPPAELEKKYPDFINKYVGKEWEAEGVKSIIHLQPLNRIHLYSHFDHEIEPNGNIAYIYIFSAIAFFILLIACINFMNLSTARSVNCAKEVCVRKIAGADRLQLIKRFLGESVFMAVIALILAIVLIELFLPVFNTLTDKELVMNYHGNLLVLLGLIGMIMFVGLVSGSYPAFFLSAFQPVNVLKRMLTAESKGSRFRKALVVTQFAISIVLIIGTGIVSSQLNYMKNKKLGFNKEQIVVMPILKNWSLRKEYKSIKNELLKNSNILAAAASSSIPGRYITEFYMHLDSLKEKVPVPTLDVDHDFIETLGIELASGRKFSKEFTTDTEEALIVNEAAVKEFGWGTADEAIGKKAEFWRKKGTVIGVVKDLHISSLHHNIEPVLLDIKPWRFKVISVRIHSKNIRTTLSFLKDTWRVFAPDYPFEYFFLDDSIDKLYKAEHKLGRIFGIFSFVSIFIACLGLFGLASFITEQRTKEIGIRKVLGASVSGIILLLIKEFTKWVLIANMIAWPVAWYVTDKWLQNFAYRINIGLWTFLLAGLLALVIALLTVSYQAIKVATTNPVEALRYE